MTTTPAGYFRDVVGEFIKKHEGEEDSEAHEACIRLLSSTN
jgi:hypothetical protein